MFRLIVISISLFFTTHVSADHVDYVAIASVEPTVSTKFTTLYTKEYTVDMEAGGCIWLFGVPAVPNHCRQTYELLPGSLFNLDDGGHNHDDSNKPLGSIKINGEATDTYEYFDFKDASHTITYTASPFSGDVVLRVTVCTHEGFNSCFYEKRLIRVGHSLTLLPASSKYTLIGGSSTGNTSHPANHYANAAMMTFIDKLSKEWAKSHPMLQINDISLKRGGHFDVGGGWTVAGNGHKQHIFGNDVDIHYVGKVNEEKFKKLVNKIGNVRFYLVHNNHHHISLRR